jgi:hypothetical protein
VLAKRCHQQRLADLNGNTVNNVGLATYDTQTLKATVDLKGLVQGQRHWLRG